MDCALIDLPIAGSIAVKSPKRGFVMPCFRFEAILSLFVWSAIHFQSYIEWLNLLTIFTQLFLKEE
jgi:hypothetical protein